MRVIAIANHKGGVGKSTTSINLGAALVRLGNKVLIVDTDAQGHTTIGLNIQTKDKQTLAELLCVESIMPADVIQKTYIPGLDVIPSDLSLAIAEMKLASMAAKEFKLRNKLKKLKGYDVVLFDCAPNFATLSMNVFAFAEEIILPLQLSYFSLEGVSNFIETINFINQDIGKVISHKIEITGVLITFFDTRTKIAREVYEQIKKIFGSKVFNSTIPQNVKISEAQSHGKSIFDYDPECKGAEAYMNLAKEVLKRRSDEQYWKGERQHQKKAVTARLR